MNYTMERQGTDWHIKSRAGLQQHAAQAPAAGMQSDGGAMGALPAGHGGGDPSALPPGHPPLGDTKKQ